MIQVSESAAQKLNEIKRDEGHADNVCLRVRVKKGGCSGLSYKMDFSSDQQEGDKIFESHGHKILVDKESFLYLLGLTLDYSGGLNGKGFVFSNPNATKACGCGASFNV